MIALTQKMEMAVATPHEFLTLAGVPAQTMYVVLRGQLEMTARDGSAVIAKLAGGSCFNETALLTGEPPDSNVVAVSYCVLYMLRKPEFQLLEKEFKKTFDGFRQAAKLAAKSMKKAGKLAATSKKAKAAGAAAAAENSFKGGSGGGGGGGGADGVSFKRSGDPGSSFTGGGGGGGRGGDSGPRQLLVVPLTRIRAVWSSMLLAALFYDAFALPAKLAFVGNFVSPGLCALDVLADLVLVGDVWLRFYLARLEDGRLVDELKAIRSRYRKVGFLPNLLGSLPLSPLLLAWPSVDARSLQAPRLLRLCRLLWRLRASQSEAQIEEQQPTNLEELLRVFRASQFDLQFAYKNLIPLVVAFFGLAHYVACAYWAVVLSQLPPLAPSDGSPWAADLPLAQRPETFESPAAAAAAAAAAGELSEWMPSEELLRTNNVWDWYYRALYFSVSTLTGLGKDLVPSSEVSILFTVFVFIVGVLVFAYITSSIVTVVNQADISSRQFQRRKIGLLGYMQDAGVDDDIVKRCGRWLDHWWHAHGARRMDRVLDSLTPTVRHRLQKSIFDIATERTPLFATADDDDDENAKADASGGANGASGEGANGASSSSSSSSSNHGQMYKALKLMPPVPFQCMYEMVDAIVFEVYNGGEWVLHKGMLAESFYIIARGSAEVILDEAKGVVIALLERGDVFGEHSAIKGAKCSASVRAKEPLELLAIPKHQLLHSVEAYPEFKARLETIDLLRQKENDFIVKWQQTAKAGAASQAVGGGKPGSASAIIAAAAALKAAQVSRGAAAPAAAAPAAAAPAAAAPAAAAPATANPAAATPDPANSATQEAAANGATPAPAPPSDEGRAGEDVGAAAATSGGGGGACAAPAPAPAANEPNGGSGIQWQEKVTDMLDSTRLLFGGSASQRPAANENLQA